MLWVFIFLHFPLSSLLTFDLVSFHSFLVFCLSLSFGPFNHFTHLHAPLCTLCFQSSPCVFCARQMFSILTTHSSHVPSVFDFFNVFSTHIKCFQSSLHTYGALDIFCMFFPCTLCSWSFMNVLFVRLVLLIFFARSLHIPGGVFNPLYTCLVFYLLFFNIGSLNPLHMFLCFMSLNILSSFSFLCT